MSNDENTITLANGVAERGDRVKRIYGDQGVLTNVFRDSERTMISVHIDGDPVPTEIRSFSDWIIDFGPTDALEVIEEVASEIENEVSIDKRDKIAVRNAAQEMKQRMQQKRKGHE